MAQNLCGTWKPEEGKQKRKKGLSEGVVPCCTWNVLSTTESSFSEEKSLILRGVERLETAEEHEVYLKF